MTINTPPGQHLAGLGDVRRFVCHACAVLSLQSRGFVFGTGLIPDVCTRPPAPLPLPTPSEDTNKSQAAVAAAAVVAQGAIRYLILATRLFLTFFFRWSDRLTGLQIKAGYGGGVFCYNLSH